MSGLRQVLGRTKAEGRAALIAYLPAWFPSRGRDVEVLHAMIGAGVDIIEVGLPYTDPLMDGPAIQTAVTSSLDAGIRIADVLETVAQVARTGAPTLVMSYWNPIERWGARRFATELAAAGGAGVITPDLPPDLATDWCGSAADAGLDTVFLVAPSSTGERIAAVSAASTGFVYAASTMGVTGARTSVSRSARDLVGRVRSVSDRPVCVGLGVSTGAQAAEVAAYADGVIVGSAFLDAITRAGPEREVAAAADLASELAAGVRRAPTGVAG